MVETYTFHEMCQTLAKSGAYIRSLQQKIGISILPRSQGYPEPYVHFMRKVVALRTFNVTLDDIRELFQKETRILEMLHYDSLSDSALWFLGDGDAPARSETHLLLTGQDLGFPIASGAIQWNLDFTVREGELFAGHEMGEDIRRALDLYVQLLERIDTRVRSERSVLQDALAWAGNGLLP